MLPESRPFVLPVHRVGVPISGLAYQVMSSEPKFPGSGPSHGGWFGAWLDGPDFRQISVLPADPPGNPNGRTPAEKPKMSSASATAVERSWSKPATRENDAATAMLGIRTRTRVRYGLNEMHGLWVETTGYSDALRPGSLQAAHRVV